MPNDDLQILMFDGGVKSLKDIKIGDSLMGDDSTPREVLSIQPFTGTCYKICPVKGASFVLNEKQSLVLQKKGQTSKLKKKKISFINLPIEDYQTRSSGFKHHSKIFKKSLEFKDQEIGLDPYFIGLWLGDGDSTRPKITTADCEIVEYLNKLAKIYNLKITKNGQSGKAFDYALSCGYNKGLARSGRNPILNELKRLNLINNKHIPDLYKFNSREVRLGLLAGLMDSDGSLGHNGFDYISELKHLSQDVVLVSRSLGLAAYMSECQKSDQNGTIGTYYRVSISGNTNMVPTKIERKKAAVRNQIKDVLVTGIKVEKMENLPYLHFEINGNNSFLLADFTVVNNNSKYSKEEYFRADLEIQ